MREMATLYIDRKEVALRHKGKSLELRQADGEIRRVPFKMVERIVVHGSVETDTGTLGALADAGIDVALLTGRFGRCQASLTGRFGNDVQRRIAQYRAHLDPVVSSTIAASLLRRKLAAQQRLLSSAERLRPDRRHPLIKGRRALQQLRTRIARENMTLEQLRGLEGAAAAAYFSAYRQLFPESLGFTARRRRPPPDPVNALLSLGYTLLYAESVKSVHAAGLDPFLGYLHEPAHGRESLAADFMEPLRPRIDALVWRLFRDRELRDEHFTRQEGSCLLGKTGRARFYAAYEEEAAALRRWLRLFTHGFIRRLPGEAALAEETRP